MMSLLLAMVWGSLGRPYVPSTCEYCGRVLDDCGSCPDCYPPSEQYGPGGIERDVPQDEEEEEEESC